MTIERSERKPSLRSFKVAGHWYDANELPIGAEIEIDSGARGGITARNSGGYSVTVSSTTGFACAFEDVKWLHSLPKQTCASRQLDAEHRTRQLDAVRDLCKQVDVMTPLTRKDSRAIADGHLTDAIRLLCEAVAHMPQQIANAAVSASDQTDQDCVAGTACYNVMREFAARLGWTPAQTMELTPEQISAIQSWDRTREQHIVGYQRAVRDERSDAWLAVWNALLEIDGFKEFKPSEIASLRAVEFIKFTARYAAQSLNADH